LLNYWATSLEKVSQGSTFTAIGKNDLESLNVIVFPRKEQEKIAEILDKVDNAIALTEALIKKLKQIKAGLLQDLLTRGLDDNGELRNPDTHPEQFKDSPLGKIPINWEVKTLGDIAPLQRGFDLPNSQLKQGNYPVVYSNGILNYHLEKKVKAPGVVTGRSGTIGQVTYVNQDYWPHNTSLWVTNFFDNFPRFIFYLYNYIGLEKFAAGSGVPTLNRNDVHSFKVFIPLRDEQEKIVKILDTQGRASEKEEEYLKKLKQKKQGLMQDLLTGKVRVNHL